MGFMEFPFVKGLEIGGWCRDCTHAARRLTRFSGPGHYCSANHPLNAECRMQNAEFRIQNRSVSVHFAFCILHFEFKVALPAGLSPASPGLEDRDSGN